MKLMMKNSKYLLYFLVSCFVLGCNNKENLIEVEIPEREVFITKTNDFPDPSTIKTKQGPFDLPNPPIGFEELKDLSKPNAFFVHYSEVHLNYANNLNTAVHNTPFENDTITDIIKKIDNRNASLKNLAGAYYNHNLYWQSITSNESSPNDLLSEAIKSSFGSFKELTNEIMTKAMALDGSGWLWVVIKGKDLAVITTVNNDTPNMSDIQSGEPLLVIDLWEHAYFPTYNNDKKKYIENSIKHLNWDFANKQYAKKVMY